jgi:GTP-binding protein
VNRDPLAQAHYLLSETEPQRLLPAKAEVAFIGRSNVGKSSLINALCEQRGLAIASKTPGRTRAINIFAVDAGRWLVDLPGYGYASGPAASRAGWPAMIEGYLTGRPSLRGTFLLFDSLVGPTKLDHQMRTWLKAHHLSHTLVGNKLDQLKPSRRAAQQKEIARALQVPVTDIHWVSSTEGTGIVTLRQHLLALLEIT